MSARLRRGRLSIGRARACALGNGHVAQATTLVARFALHRGHAALRLLERQLTRTQALLRALELVQLDQAAVHEAKLVAVPRRAHDVVAAHAVVGAQRRARAGGTAAAHERAGARVEHDALDPQMLIELLDAFPANALCEPAAVPTKHTVVFGSVP